MTATPTRFALPQLEDIRVASPCTADWDAMSGDDRARHCAQCDKKVYNLSGMTRDQAHRLVFDTEGKKCVRFFRREDGSVLTADCPVGLALLRQRAGQIGRRVVAAMALLLAGGVALATGRSEWGRPTSWGNRLGDRQPFAEARRLAGKPPSQRLMIMGEICAPASKPLPLVSPPTPGGTP